MKIQPIDASTSPEEMSACAVAVRPEPAMKSRLRRLFRIGGPPEAQTQQLRKEGSVELDPSSVCLDKMVQNFIEEGVAEKQQAQIKCGRNRCNCFNGSDGSDEEADYSISSADVSDLLKGLMVCVSVNEKNVLAETARIVEMHKAACKRKADFGRLVAESLIGIGFDASMCRSKWEKSSSFPAAGYYDYIDVIVEGERLIVDIDFRSEFEMARATKAYKSILLALPCIFVGKSDRLSRIVTLVSEAAKQSLKKKGMHLPPWRRTEYVRAKWLSPHTRLTTTEAVVRPTPAHSVSDGFIRVPCLKATTNVNVAADQQAVGDSVISRSLSPVVASDMADDEAGTKMMMKKKRAGLAESGNKLVAVENGYGKGGGGFIVGGLAASLIVMVENKP